MTPSQGADRFVASCDFGPSIMGILNVTPDSFHDGGNVTTVQGALKLASRMLEEGADIVDVGGESTRPGHQSIGTQEELDRVVPVIETIARELDTPISIDTTKAAVALVALQSGAHIVNDIWGLQGDPEMTSVVADAGAGAIITHNRTTVVEDLDIVEDLQEFFDRSVALAATAGISRGRMILDPGVGFGKTVEQNLAVISEVPRLMRFDLPVLVGVSHKSFIGRTIGDTTADRLAGTIAAGLRAIDGGAKVLRVHDVSAHAQAIQIWAATMPKSVRGSSEGQQ